VELEPDTRKRRLELRDRELDVGHAIAADEGASQCVTWFRS
jgi:hypothetical protein